MTVAGGGTGGAVGPVGPVAGPADAPVSLRALPLPLIGANVTVLMLLVAGGAALGARIGGTGALVVGNGGSRASNALASASVSATVTGVADVPVASTSIVT